uniref:Uncharacterized protein n=1 Tax=Oryza rufipogon TaxID=4529 RepID=A0A0E0NF39_ORYRU
MDRRTAQLGSTSGTGLPLQPRLPPCSSLTGSPRPQPSSARLDPGSASAASATTASDSSVSSTTVDRGYELPALLLRCRSSPTTSPVLPGPSSAGSPDDWGQGKAVDGPVKGLLLDDFGPFCGAQGGVDSPPRRHPRISDIGVDSASTSSFRLAHIQLDHPFKRPATTTSATDRHQARVYTIKLWGAAASPPSGHSVAACGPHLH